MSEKEPPKKAEVKPFLEFTQKELSKETPVTRRMIQGTPVISAVKQTTQPTKIVAIKISKKQGDD